MPGGILGLIMNGVDNQRNGLPFFTTPEQKAEHFKQRDELRKEEIKTLHEQMKDATANGNMPQLIAAAERAKSVGINEATLTPYFEGIKQPMEMQKNTMQFLQQITGGQGGGIPGGQAPSGGAPTVVPQSGGSAAPSVPQSSESAAPGTPSRSYNLGNIRKDANSFKSFNSPEEGVTAAADLLRRKYKGLTLTQIGYKWAPPSENDTPTWISNVSKASGLSPKEQINMDDPEQVKKLVSGIGAAEKSKEDLAHFTPDVVHSGVQKAFNPSMTQPVSPGASTVHTTNDTLAQMPKLFDPSRGVEVTFGKNGIPTGFKIDVSKMAVPTEEALLRTIAADPVMFRAYVQNKAFGAVTFQPVHNELIGVDGVRAVRGDGTVLGTTWDNQQTSLTPRQKLDQSVQQAREGATASEQGKIEALQAPMQPGPNGQVQTYGDVQAAQKAAEAASTAAATKVASAQAGQQTITTPQGPRTVQQATEKIPEEVRKASVEAKAKVYSFQRFSQDVQDAGTQDGKFDMNNLPIGPFSHIKELPGHYGITQDKYNVDRQLFIDATTSAIADLYSTGGKQLSDKEIENLKANVLAPDLAPHEWISRAARWWEKGQDHLRSQIETWRAEGHDTSQLEAVLAQSQKLSPWNWLPKDLQPKRVRASQVDQVWLQKAKEMNPKASEDELIQYFEKTHAGGKK